MPRKDSSVQDLDQLWTQARTARARLEPTWYMNLAYTMGEQWLSWDGRQLYRPQLRRSRITVVDNRILGCVNTEIARMTKQRPVFSVTPNSGDEEDANAAELAEQLMEYLWKHLKLQEHTMKALRWSRICAAGFLKVFWDPSIGDSVNVLVDGQGNLLDSPSGGPIHHGTPEAALALALGGDQGVRPKKVAQGDIRVEVRSPFQIGCDPLCDSFVEAEWLVEESVKSEDYVKQRYGVDVPADTPANPGLIEARMGQVLIPGVGSYKGVKIREYWSKPSATHPNGRRAVWAPEQQGKKDGGRLLLEDDHPFDPFPYVMLSGIPVPGRLWPTCVVEQLRGPQTELNKVKSQIAENRNRVGNPTIAVSRQAVQDWEKFVDSFTMPGGLVPFDDTYPHPIPQYIAAPELPAYVVEEIQRIEESIQEISGQHEVTSAQVPPGVTAASAINLLQEADDTRLGPGITDYEHQLGMFGQKILKLAAHYYTDARTIRIGGDNGAWQIFDFRGTMLRGNTHVDVQAGSAFPQSKAARQAALMDLLRMLAQMQVPLQGKDLAQFIEDYQIGGNLRFLGEFNASETQANRENVLMGQGNALPINDYDEDDIHVQVHQEFQRQPRYTTLPPDAQRAISLHVAAHRERAEQQQQQELEQQMQMEGKVPPNLTASALQDQHELSQLQGAQQVQGQAQQQGLDQAAAEQKQRQGAEQHHSSQLSAAQQAHMAQELHDQKVRHAEEIHQQQMQLAQRRAEQQAKQQQSQQGSNRKAA